MFEGFSAGGQAFGGIAQVLLANNFNVNALRTNATLRKDEWQHYDKAILKEVQLRLTGVSDLLSRGLSLNIPNGMGATVLQYEDESDINDASVSMDGLNDSPADRPDFQIKNLPLPITHKEYNFSSRVLAASRTTGMSLDTTMAMLAGRKIANKLEDYLFNGSGNYTFGGGTIFGYTDFPQRNTITGATAWTALTGAQILDEVLSMKQLNLDAQMFGPFVLYIPSNYETVMDEDFKDDGDLTIRGRLLMVEGITSVKVSDFLADNNVVLVQMTQDVVRMVVGMPVTNLQWETKGGLGLNFKVMTIQVPQIRSTQAGNCGVTHLNVV